MGIKTKIYCGHDFSEEEARLNLVVQTCKKAGVLVPPEVFEKLNNISEGSNQIFIEALLEQNGDSKRYRVKTQDIMNMDTDYIYFEFSKFKTNEDDKSELTDLILVDENDESGPIAKFFKSKEDEDYEFL